MKNILYILYQPYKWLFFCPYLALSTLFFGSLTVILVFITNPRIASFIGGAIWARLNVYLTPMIVKVFGRENIDKQQSYVIVCNHQSHYDVLVLYGWLGVDFRWVIKSELRKIPGLGIGCEKIGHIFIDRSDTIAALAAIDAAKDRIVDGTSVMFFPEGSRSRNGELGRFKKGAFKMAINLRIQVLPITIIGTKNILPPKTINLLPGKAKMIIHKPIDIAEYNDDNIKELMEKTRGIIRRGLDSPESV
ncbi:MAG: 1-acyl-sn-glycerol-3-phosphate acyltransferase [Deltaproteobacteria bacterium]|nr:1-acyl-sn-glycerol-3-phosphate acyltransferase [Deltaproteobacteria bacterium]MBW2169007.1 1-acyl-sn-glycerol-3-phosphate acyltransferase [Deltaproteobacteria bacterium]